MPDQEGSTVGGVEHSAPFKMSSLTFNDGCPIDTSDASIVVLVGPNNAGKTRALQEMEQFLKQISVAPDTLFALSGVTIDKPMTGGDLARWFRANRALWQDPNDPRKQLIGGYGSGQFPLDQVFANWRQDQIYLGTLASLLLRTLWCGERLNYLSPASRLEPGEMPNQPLQFLISHQAVLEAYREAFRSAFGMNVIIDAWGNAIRIRLSRNSTQDDFRVTSNNGLPDPEVTQRLNRLPLIETQSDGVRSFSGILLTLMTGRFPLVLIDEPEAFLHPPQARLLGQHLARLHLDGQVFVATHSLDVLLGLMEARPEEVLIIRLTRKADVTSSHILEPSRLAAIWRDPFLRFSRALDGLFHHGVVVCEGDTDCLFYSSVASRQRSEDSPSAGLDIMFTYAGGKHRVPLITRSLRAVGVPVRVVVDFDALREKEMLHALVEGIGSAYSASIERDRALIDAHIRGSVPNLKVGPLKNTIDGILGSDPDRDVTRAVADEVKKALQPSAGWRAAKEHGKGVVPSGDASVAVERLLGRLQEIGVFVVPYGAVESFVRVVGGKGTEWAVAVIEGDHIAGAMEAHSFVDSLLNSLRVESTT